MEKIEINLIESVKNILKSESESLLKLSQRVDFSFECIIREIYNTKGRVIVSGVGKSGMVGRKLVSTLNSTGTPAIFLHATDAAHGDIGAVTKEDLVLLISKSGDTQELRRIVPYIKRQGNRLVAIVSNENSFIAQNADLYIYVPIEQEAGEYNIVPTTSAVMQMAVGDAIAMVLSEMKGLTGRDFVNLHPGGTIGESLKTEFK